MSREGHGSDTPIARAAQGERPVDDTPQPTARRTAGEISAIMRRVHDRDTAPELAFRRALHARGLRYRVVADELPGKPDVVFPRRRLAIFIDGDFWHGGQWETRGLRRLEQQFARTETRDYWLRKIRRTMQRDATNTARLQAMGWTAQRFWESDIRRALDDCVEMTVGVLAAPDGAGAYTPLAEKSVALRSELAEVWRQGLESEGWHVVHDGTSAGRPTAPVTLMVGEPAMDNIQPGSPLVLLDFNMEALRDDDVTGLPRRLLALTEHGYRVDLFVGHWSGYDGSGGQRLFAIGVRAAARGTTLIRERRGAYTLAHEPSDERPQALVDFMRARPEVAWQSRALPPLPLGGVGPVESVAWIAATYLNPVVNELLRGQPLYPKV